VVVVILRSEERDDRVVGDGVRAARLEATRSRRHAECVLSIAWLGVGLGSSRAIGANRTTPLSHATAERSQWTGATKAGRKSKV
jgi:hypothetical protein